MSYNIDLYVNSSDSNVINKNITLLATSTCDLKAPIDVVNPTIYIGADDTYAACNYVYIPAFGRYYYAKVIGGTSQTITMECSSDPIMSFKTGILSAKAVIARNPWHYDKYIPDGNMPIESRTVRGTYKFPNDPFSGSNNCYVLTILGCGS